MDVEKPAPEPQRKGITEADAGKRIAELLNPNRGKSEPEVKKEPEAQANVEAEVTAEDEPPEGDPPAQEAPPKFKVQVDGEEIEVDQDELLRGYSRTANYTRKSQKLADERKSFEAELNAVRAERQQYAQTLSQLKAQLTEPTGIDMEKLLSEDPLEFVRQQALVTAKKERLAAIESEERRLAEVAAGERQKALQERMIDEERKLLSAIPDLKDGRKSNAIRDRMIGYARELGYTDQELGALVDHRVALAFYEGSLHRKAKADAKKAVEKAKDSPIKTATPGNVQDRVVNADLAASRERFYQKRDLNSMGAHVAKLLAQSKR